MRDSHVFSAQIAGLVAVALLLAALASSLTGCSPATTSNESGVEPVTPGNTIERAQNASEEADRRQILLEAQIYLVENASMGEPELEIVSYDPEGGHATVRAADPGGSSTTIYLDRTSGAKWQVRGD